MSNKRDYVFMPWGELDSLQATIEWWRAKRIELGLNNELDGEMLEAQAIALELRTRHKKPTEEAVR